MCRLILNLSFLLMLNFNSFANDKFIDAIIYKVGGDEIKCQIKLPIDKTPSKLVIKSTSQMERKTIDADQVDYFILSTVKDDFVFKFTKFYFLGKKVREKNPERKLMFLEKDCSNYQTFLLATRYNVNKSGDLILERSKYLARTYFFQRTGDDCPFDLTTLYIIGSKGKIPKKRHEKFQDYVKQDPDFLQFVKLNRRIGINEIDEFLESICE